MKLVFIFALQITFVTFPVKSVIFLVYKYKRNDKIIIPFDFEIINGKVCGDEDAFNHNIIIHRHTVTIL